MNDREIQITNMKSLESQHKFEHAPIAFLMRLALKNSFIWMWIR